MIIGTGIDIADIRRIDRTLERFGRRFLDRVFTEIEQAKSEPRRARAASYAKRWAAKEACSKALGSGIRMGVNWREMEVVNLETGQPTLRLHGGAAERLARLTPSGHEARLFVTITDDHPYAQASVLIEAVPDGTPPVRILPYR
ncbi:MAG: holo-ACP synthase [Pseudomonadota bacterium]